MTRRASGCRFVDLRQPMAKRVLFLAIFRLFFGYFSGFSRAIYAYFYIVIKSSLSAILSSGQD